MDGDSGSGHVNSAFKLARDCWDRECDGRIVVTLAQVVANYFSQCTKCRKPVVYRGTGESHSQDLERPTIDGIACRGWTVIPSALRFTLER